MERKRAARMLFRYQQSRVGLAWKIRAAVIGAHIGVCLGARSGSHFMMMNDLLGNGNGIMTILMNVRT